MGSRLALALLAVLLALSLAIFLLRAAPHNAELRTRISGLTGYQQAEVPNTKHILQKLAALEPLDTRPYAAHMLSTRHTDEALQLADEVILRNPRSRSAWLVRLRSAAEKSDIPAMLHALTRLYTLDPDRRTEYISVLAQLGNQAESEEAFRHALDSYPAWGPVVVDVLLENSTDVSRLAGILQHYPEKRSVLLERLIAQGSRDKAYTIFLSFISFEEHTTLTTPVDSGFEGVELPRPFNWTFNRTLTRLLPDAGLTARFPGRSNTWLAWQIVALPPGGYDLTAEMQGQTALEGGYFRWDLTCAGGTKIGHLDVSELSVVRRSYQARVVVPEVGCPYQRLTFRGMSGLFPVSADAVVHRITLASAKSPQP